MFSIETRIIIGLKKYPKDSENTTTTKCNFELFGCVICCKMFLYLSIRLNASVKAAVYGIKPMLLAFYHLS